MTPSNAQFKAGQPGGAANAAPTAASGPSGPQATTAPTTAPPAANPAQAHPDPTQNNFGMENGGAMVCTGPWTGEKHGGHMLTDSQVDFTNMDFANPLTSEDVLTDFNFDAFLHDDADTGNFDFSASYGGMDATGEIGAE